MRARAHMDCTDSECLPKDPDGCPHFMESYNPMAHWASTVFRDKYNHPACICGWHGENHDLHQLAMRLTYEVKKPHIIEEEPEL